MTSLTFKEELIMKATSFSRKKSNKLTDSTRKRNNSLIKELEDNFGKKENCRVVISKKIKRLAPQPPKPITEIVVNGVQNGFEQVENGHDESFECPLEQKSPASASNDRLCYTEQKQEEVDQATTSELLLTRQTAIDEITVKKEPLQEWCVTKFVEYSDYLTPRQKMDALKSFSSNFAAKKPPPPPPPKKKIENGMLPLKIASESSQITETTFKLHNRQETARKVTTGLFWPGVRFKGKPGSTTAPKVRQLWNTRILKEETERERYEVGPRNPRKRFPQWWSNDTLSASLIGAKLSPTEDFPTLTKGNSLESLLMTSPQWYDPKKIRQSISRESIANSSATKNQWEERVEKSLADTPPPFRSVTETPPPVRPNYFDNSYGKDEIQQNLNVIQKDIQQHQQKEIELRLQRSPQPPAIQRATSYVDFDKEKTLFLWYISSKPELLSSLGITVPTNLSQQMQQLRNHVPKVELREVDSNSNPTSNGYSSKESTLERTGGGVRKGRYVKHMASTTSPNQKWIKKHSDSPTQPRATTPVREHRKHSPPKVDIDDDTYYRSRGETLIAQEIRENKEREDELRRSRTELGLPTLNDIIEYWRVGQARSMPPLRGAQSLDHLQFAGVQQEKEVNESPKFKTGSLDHLHQAHLVPVENGLKREQEMIDGLERTRQNNDASPIFVSGNSANKSNYDKFLSNHHPHKTVIGIPTSTLRVRNTDHVPVEVRIEREVIELRHREAELKRDRLNRDSPQQFITSEYDTYSEDNFQEESNPVVHREYVGQRNPNFDPNLMERDSSPYGLRRGSNPDVLFLEPSYCI